MKTDLERLLQAQDALKQARNAEEDARLRASYEAELETAAANLGLRQDLLDRMIHRYYPRWVRANLPPGFPKHLGLD
jgi:hypothetical protein